MSKRKPVEYDQMEVGEVLGPVEVAIDTHFLRSAAFTVDDYHEWSLGDASPFGKPVAQGAALLCDLLRLLYTRFDPNQDLGLHQHEEFQLFSPVFVGETVRLEGRFVEKYIKRGRGYIITEAEARTVGDDRLIIRHRATETADLPGGQAHVDTKRDAPPSRRVVAQLPKGCTFVKDLSGAFAAGDPMRGPVKTIYQDQMSVYSGAHFFWESIHTNRDVAAKLGMKDTVAQGLMMVSYISEWATRLFGKSWFQTGKVNATFLASVFPGDVLSIFGIISETKQSAEGTTVEVEFWVNTQNEETAAVGWFSGLHSNDPMKS